MALLIGVHFERHLSLQQAWKRSEERSKDKERAVVVVGGGGNSNNGHRYGKRREQYARADEQRP